MNILREKAVTIKYKRNNEMYAKILRFFMWMGKCVVDNFHVLHSYRRGTHFRVENGLS